MKDEVGEMLEDGQIYMSVCVNAYVHACIYVYVCTQVCTCKCVSVRK